MACNSTTCASPLRLQTAQFHHVYISWKHCITQSFSLVLGRFRINCNCNHLLYCFTSNWNLYCNGLHSVKCHFSVQTTTKLVIKEFNLYSIHLFDVICQIICFTNITLCPFNKSPHMFTGKLYQPLRDKRWSETSTHGALLEMLLSVLIALGFLHSGSSTVSCGSDIRKYDLIPCA